MNMQMLADKPQVVSKEILKNMYPYTITTLKPRCTKAFSHGICFSDIYHNMYHRYTMQKNSKFLPKNLENGEKFCIFAVQLIARA